MQQLRRLPLKHISVPIATSNAVAYASGDQVGIAVKVPEVALDSGCLAYIKSVDAVSKTAITPALAVLFFSEQPVNAVADNSPVDIADAELVSKYMGHVNIAAGDWETLANGAVATKILAGSGIIVKPSAARSKDIWVLVMAKAAITFTSVQDLTLKIDIEQG